MLPNGRVALRYPALARKQLRKPCAAISARSKIDLASPEMRNWASFAEENLSSFMRVLIATVTAGGGHLASASALEEAWRTSRPDDELTKVDLVKFFSQRHRKSHGDGYVKLVEHAAELSGMVFKKTDQPDLARRLNRLKRLFPS